MRRKINELTIAIIVANGFEESEMLEPKKALEKAGAKTVLISPVKGKVKSWKSKEWSHDYPVDKLIHEVRAEDFDGLVLPGGVMNPDSLRLEPAVIEFIKAFIKADKPIASICHGPWTLIDAEGVRGKKMTSWPSLKKDLTNAGANWMDEEVVRDGNLITSRKPADLPAFNKAYIALLQERNQ
jgi:protease I